MKKAIFTFGFFIFFLTLFGQQIDSGFNPAVNMLPKSPTAAALIQFQDFPANPYTGSGVFRVPLAQVSDNDLSLNLALQYQAVSHPVNQVVDRMGMNWQLTGAGGMITRKMRGLPDDAKVGEGFLEFREEHTYQNVLDWLTNENESEFRLLTTCADAQPDEFYFTIGAYSGTFAFDWNTANGGLPQVISKDEVKVLSFTKDNDGQIIQWKLVDPMGVIYTFAELETTEAFSEFSFDMLCTSGNQIYTTGWYVTQMESPNIVGQTINFSYSDYVLKYDWQYTQAKTFRLYNEDNDCGALQSSPSQSESRTTINGKRLTAITSSNNRFSVSFNANTPRTDTDGLITPTNFTRLDEIVVRGAVGQVLYRYELDYIYQNRLLLKSIQKIGSLGTTIPKWEFDYYGGTFPAITSQSIDHYGFLNGANNTTLLPSYIHRLANRPPIFFNGANREPNATAAQTSLLKSITQPTGGSIELAYENHEYSYVSTQTVQSQMQFAATEEQAIVDVLSNDDNVDWVEATSPYFTVSSPEPDVLMTLLVNGTTYQTFGGPDQLPTAILEDQAGNALATIRLDAAEQGNDPIQPNIQPPFSNSFYLATGTYRLRVMARKAVGTTTGQRDYIRMQADWANINTMAPITRKDAGGVRIRTIIQKNEKGEQAGYRRYVYETDDGTGYSSGAIYAEPVYTYESAALTPNGDDFIECDYLQLVGASRIIAGNTSGSYIGYGRVEEWIGENAEGGKIIHEFDSPREIPNGLDIAKPFGQPLSNAFKTGLSTTRTLVDDNDVVIQEQTNTYIYPMVDIPSVKVSLGRIAPVPFTASQGANPFYASSVYATYDFTEDKFAFSFRPLRLGYSLNNVATTMLDDVTTTTDLDYLASTDVATDYVHNNPVESTTYNSNGDKHVVKTKYATEVDANPVDFREPAAITELVNRNMLDIPLEIKKEVNDVFQGGQRTEYALFTPDELVLPADFIQILHTGDTLQRGRIIDYNSDGYAEATIQRGYPRRTFNWDTANDLLLSVDYRDWTESFTWYGNNRRIETQTAIDGQVTRYYYDDLQRLNEKREREENVTTQIIYEYANQNNPLNSVQTSVSFTDNTPAQTKIDKLDGLGRPVQTLINGELRNEVFYDNIGRVDKQTYLTGNFTNFKYDNSPLQRMTREIYPDGTFKEMRYGKETLTGFDYFATTIIDENRNWDVSLVDKIGRTHLTRQVTDTINVTGLETLYEYDDRDNRTYIYSPKANKTSQTATPNLVYAYQYDARNRVQSKYVPGMTVGITIDHTYYADSDWLETVTDAAGDRVRITYDDYGREDETFLLLNGGGAEIPLTDSDYDGDGIRSTGRLTNKIVTVLNDDYDDAALRTRLNHAFSYDTYGRVDVTTKDNHIGGSETITDTYNLGDWLTVKNRVHTSGTTYGNTNLVIDHTFEHDVFGRVERCDYDIDGNERTLYNQQWNSRDQLLNRTYHNDLLGNGVALQSIDYLYNERGWLRQINQPLDVFNDMAAVGECTPSGRVEMEGMENMMDMTFCGNVVADLNELLSVRFSPNLNVDCYNPCANSSLNVGVGTPVSCPNTVTENPANTKSLNTQRYTKTVQIPCDGSTQTVVRPDLSAFPPTGNILYRIRDCFGVESYCWQEDLPSNSNDYVVLQELNIQNPQQLFSLRTDCGEPQTVGVEGLILAVGNAQNVAIDNYVLTDGNCDTRSPDCTPAEQQEQEEYITTLTSDPKTTDDLDYPFYLVRVKLCSGDEVHLTAAELRGLPNNYVALQRIFVSEPTQTFQVGSNITDADTEDLFFQSLHYDEVNTTLNNTPQSNGNISYQTWQVRGRNEQFYHYEYDALDRILEANFSERDGNSLLMNNIYTTTYGNYDANGNIGLITRNSHDLSDFDCSTPIDNLTLNYNGNRILNIRDNIGEANDLERGFPASTTAPLTYDGNTTNPSYDDKGNFIYDQHRGIQIEYNHLNLPRLFTLNEGIIGIEYDADGQKLRKTVTGDQAIVKDYCMGIEYEDNVLKSVYNDAGRVVNDGGNWEFQYFIKDHLNSVRVAFAEGTDGLDILEESHFYSFGGEMEGEWNMTPITPKQLFKYNDKEDMAEYGLDWSDFNNRWYLKWVPHFSGVDPISDEFPHLSVYNYASLNPVRFIDLHGLQGTTNPLFEVKRQFTALMNYLGISEQPSQNEGGLLAPSNPDASDFHDTGGGKVPFGFEMMTGSNDNPASNTASQAELEEGGTSVIIDEIFTPGSGNAGGEARKLKGVGKVHDFSKAADRLMDFVDRLDSSSEPQMDTFVVCERCNDTINIQNYDNIHIAPKYTAPIIMEDRKNFDTIVKPKINEN